MTAAEVGIEQRRLLAEEKHPSYDTATSSEENENKQSINGISPPWFVYVVAGCAAINSCNVGFDIGVNSPAGILLQQDLQLSDFQLEIFMGSINLFALPGALLNSYVVGRWGMKTSFVLASTLFVLGILITILARYWHIILLGRVLVGLGVGLGFAVTPNYITEISPKEHRGYFTSWSEIGCNVGILLGFSTGLLFPGRWRLMFSVGCIMPLVLIGLTFGVLVESPRWLAQKQRYQDSLEVLTRLYPPGFDVSTVLNDIQRDIDREKDLQHTEHLDWNFLVQPCPVIRRMLITGLGIAISHEICGIDAIQYYLVFILQASGITGQLQQARLLLALGGLKLACLLVASSFVDRLGRRPLMMVSVSGMMAALLVVASIFLNNTPQEDDPDAATNSSTVWVVVGGLALYLASFSLGMGPLGWVMPPEIFSTSIRSKAVSLTTFANRLTATIMASTMLSIANTITWGGYFCLLAAINLTILVLACLFLPETKGRRLEEMTDFFSTSSTGK